MRQLFLSLTTCSIACVALACGGGTNVNVSTMGNHASNVTNTVSNAVTSAVNSAANAVSSATTSSPESFMKDACQGGMAEVKLGELASKNAKDPEVKKFGQMMVTEHGAANKELEELAKKKNITLPNDMGSHQSTYDKFSKLTGADFDKQYVDDMVSDHETDLKDCEKQAENSSDPDVKAFAAKGAQMIKKHLDAIKAIQSKMNSSGNSSANSAKK